MNEDRKCTVCCLVFISRKNNLSYICSKCRNKVKEITGRDRTRSLIRLRDKDTCQVCKKKWKKSNGKRRFDVHHKDLAKDKTKQYDVYEKEKNNLITLCRSCHFKLHKRV